MTRQQHSTGMTLLEVLVALVIFSGAGLAMFGLVNNSLLGLAHVQDISRQTRAVEKLAEYLEAFDPAELQSGTFLHEDLRVNWRTRVLAGPRSGRSSLGARGSYDLELHEMTFSVLDGNREIGEFRLRRISYSYERSFEDAQ